MSTEIDISSFMKSATVKRKKIEHLLFAAGKSNDAHKHVLEFGVRHGKTITHIANHFKDDTIFGFDSFEGLPEPWVKSPRTTDPIGKFKVDKLPTVPSNVILTKGWFDDTLPKWVESNPDNIKFLHIDSDLYSSCKTILEVLNNQIVQSTIIVFDELCDWEKKTGYSNWKEGEWKSLNEWIRKFNRKITVLGRTPLAEGSIIVEQ